MKKTVLFTGMLLYALSGHSQITKVGEMIAQKRFENQRAKLRAEFPNLVPESDPSYQKHEGMVNSFHQNHVGQILFSKTAIPRDVSSDVGLSSTFTFGDDIHARLFLQTGFPNYYCYKSGSNTPIETNDHRIVMYVYVNDRKQEDEDMIKTFPKRDMKTKTSVDFQLYGTGKGGQEELNIKLVDRLNRLDPGTHQIRLEVYARAHMEGFNNYGSTLKPIASGEFTIVKEKGAVLKRGGDGFESYRAQKDSELEKATLAKVTQAFVKPGAKYEKIVIGSHDWEVERNPYNSTVLGRRAKVYAYFKDDGACYLERFFMIQDFDGLNYQKTIRFERDNAHWIPVDCD